MHWFLPHTPVTAGIKPVQSQEPGAQSGSAAWVTGTRGLESSLAVSQEAHEQELEVGAELQLNVRCFDTGCRHAKWCLTHRTACLPSRTSRFKIKFQISPGKWVLTKRCRTEWLPVLWTPKKVERICATGEFMRGEAIIFKVLVPQSCRVVRYGAKIGTKITTAWVYTGSMWGVWSWGSGFVRLNKLFHFTVLPFLCHWGWDHNKLVRETQRVRWSYRWQAYYRWHKSTMLKDQGIVHCIHKRL